MDKRLKKIAEHYGYDCQSRQLVEEMAELTQAINKFWRKQLKWGSKELHEVPFATQEEINIAEEIGDVEICLEQIKWLLGMKQAVNASKELKIVREIERIEKQKKEIKSNGN